MYPPPPSSSSRRARPLLVLLAVVLALVLVAGCTGRKKPPTGYGNTTKTNFPIGCVETANETGISNPTRYCKCSYKEIEATIPFEDFKQINSDLSDTPDSLPKELLKIRDKCVDEAGGSG
jgi:hypothetical protein